VSATIRYDACEKGVRYRNRHQAIAGLSRSREWALARGCPNWLLPVTWFYHPGCHGWHLCRDFNAPRPTGLPTAA
jgi:hypothetical protein